MLVATHLRDLLVEAGALRHPHLGAASGLVIVAGWMYFIADDEHHLGCLPVESPTRDGVQIVRIRAGELPAAQAERKRAKPDFEALVALPGNKLLVIGSGSRPEREAGVLLALAPEGGVRGQPGRVDLRPLYSPLRTEFADLNIEGAFASDQRMHLLQRGNTSGNANACISYALPDFMAWLEGRARAPEPAAITHHDLGAADGIPYGFTDGAMWPGRGWLFSAVAEDTDDSYADGACASSAIGCIGLDGQLQWMTSLQGAPKVEGIALAGALTLWMVTDADDPTRASQLLAVELGSSPQ